MSAIASVPCKKEIYGEALKKITDHITTLDGLDLHTSSVTKDKVEAKTYVVPLEWKNSDNAGTSYVKVTLKDGCKIKNSKIDIDYQAE